MDLFAKSARIIIGALLLSATSAGAQAGDAATGPQGQAQDGAQSAPETTSEATGEQEPGGIQDASRSSEDGEVPPSGPLHDGQDEQLSSCMASHEKAQLARLSGGFLEARGELKACSETKCPEALRRDCLQWRQELDALIPSLIVSAEDNSGDLEDAKVFIDGVEVRSSLDGRPIPLDPGTHVVRIEASGGRTSEKKIVLSEGERNRRLAFDFRLPEPQAPREQPVEMETIRPVPVGVYVLGGVSFVGLGVAVGFGSDAWSKARTARDLCSPLCDPEVSRAVKERAAVADIALGVSLASLVGAIVVYSYRPERIVRKERVAIGLVPRQRGASLEVGGIF